MLRIPGAALPWSKCQLFGRIHSCSPLTSLQPRLPVSLLTPPKPYPFSDTTDVDHNYWGRPEQQEAWYKSRNSLPRKTYIWTRAMAASDLMGMVRGEWRLCENVQDTWTPCSCFARQARAAVSQPASSVPAG